MNVSIGVLSVIKYIVIYEDGTFFQGTELSDEQVSFVHDGYADILKIDMKTGKVYYLDPFVSVEKWVEIPVGENS